MHSLRVLSKLTFINIPARDEHVIRLLLLLSLLNPKLSQQHPATRQVSGQVQSAEVLLDVLLAGAI